MNIENSKCRELCDYIEDLTTSGQRHLDLEKLKKVKNICRISDDYIKHAYYLLMVQLKYKHAEVRFSTFQIINELFNRSHRFRELLITDFQTFVELTIGTDAELPPPKKVAMELKFKTLEAIQQWYEKYGEGYKKLILGYNFLKECNNINFGTIQAHIQTQRLEEQENERQKQNALKKIWNEFEELFPDIQSSLTEIDNCLNLILPSIDFVNVNQALPPVNSNLTKFLKTDNQNNEFSLNSHKTKQIEVDTSEKKKFCPDNSLLTEKIILNAEPLSSGCDKLLTEISKENKLAITETNDNYEESDLEDSKDLRHHGFANMKFNLTINITPGKIDIKENQDNSVLLLTLKERKALIVYKYLPKIIKWIKLITKVDSTSDKIKRLLDLKMALESIIHKCNELNIQEMKIRKSGSDDSEDDFEEVPEKEGYEATVPAHLFFDCAPSSSIKRSKTTSTSWSLKNKSEDASDPTTSASTLRIWKEKLKNIRNEISSDYNSISPNEKSVSSSDERKKLLAKAPKVNFDLDLLHWEDKKLEPPTVVRYDSLHRFWTPRENEEVVSDEAIAALRTRTIAFTGEFQPVQWNCRAPLSNGKLCPRQDRIKCPFHGVVIPRDDKGYPTDPKDIERFKKEEEIKKAAEEDWKNPEYLKKLEASTGITLTYTKGKGKKSKKKESNLTDLKAINNTSKKRLEAKVFNRSAMRRVSTTLDALDRKRLHDKFGSSWTYAYNT